MSKFIALFGILLAPATGMAKYLVYPYNPPNWTYNLRALSSIFENNGGIGMKYYESYLWDEGEREYKDKGAIKLDARIPILKSVDFLCNYTTPRNYPDEIFIQWNNFGLGGGFFQEDGISEAGAKIAAFCPLTHSFGIMLDFAFRHLTEPSSGMKKSFLSSNIRWLLWEEKKFPRFLFIKTGWEGRINGGIKADDIFERLRNKGLVETGFARDVLGVICSFNVGVHIYEKGQHEHLMRVDPLCGLRLTTPELKNLFIGFEWEVEKLSDGTMHSWSAGVYYNLSNH